MIAVSQTEAATTFFGSLAAIVIIMLVIGFVYWLLGVRRRRQARKLPQNTPEEILVLPLEETERRVQNGTLRFEDVQQAARKYHIPFADWTGWKR